MSAENLLTTGQRKQHPPDCDEVQRRLAAAERNLRDADLLANSPETPTECPYKAAMQCAVGSSYSDAR